MIGLTHNQYIKLFSDLAIAHKDINSFGTGDLWEYMANESDTINPVTLWVVIQPETLQGKTGKPKYTLVVMDSVDYGQENLDEVYSDTKRIAQDLVALLRQPYYEGFFTLEQNVVFEPFSEKFDSEMAGHQFDLVFNQPFLYDACEVNINGLPAVNMDSIYINTSQTVWGQITGTLSNQTDLQNALNAKENSITAGTTSQYWRGDKTFQTLDTSVVPENTNLYYTQARFDTAFGLKSTTNLSEGTNLYYTAARFNSAFAAKSTSDLSEGTNLYFTNARGIASTLTGYISGAGTISSADSVLSAIQKLNGNIGTKQDTLVSGTNLKTVGGVSLLGSGDIGSISTTYTDAKIKGSLVATAGVIAYGTGTADTVTSDANFNYDGARFLSLRNTTANNYGGGILLGNDSASNTMAFFVHGSTYAGNWTGTSIPFAGKAFMQAGSSGAGSYVNAATTVYNLIGTTATNLGTRLDSTGLRVGQIQNLHNSNTVALQVDGSSTHGVASSSHVHIFNVGSSTAQIIVRERISSTTTGAIYMGVASGSESASNYTLNYNGTLNINTQSATSAMALKVGDNSAFTITPGNTTSSAYFTLATRSRTTLTATTNIPVLDLTGNTQSWAAGTVASQYFVYLRSQTAAAASGSTFTYISGLTAELPTKGTNATFTTVSGIYVPTSATVATTSIGIDIEAPSGGSTNYAARFGGDINFNNNASKIIATGTGSNGLVIKNLKNSANTTVSGTAKTIEIDIAGVPYYFLVYPTTSA